MKILIMAIAFILGAATVAQAGDKNSIYFSQESGLLRVGFSGTACGSIPMPGVSLDAERNCARVPTTFMYKLTKSDGSTIKEVRKLEDTHEETCTRSIDTAGNPTETCSIDVVSGRSVDGNFGRKQSFSLLGIGIGEADGASNSRRTFSTGLAAARRSTQDPVTAP